MELIYFITGLIVLVVIMAYGPLGANGILWQAGTLGVGLAGLNPTFRTLLYILLLVLLAAVVFYFFGGLIRLPR